MTHFACLKMLWVWANVAQSNQRPVMTFRADTVTLVF